MDNDMNRFQIVDEIRRMLSIDLNCSQSDLNSGHTVIREALKLEGRRCFPFRFPSITVVTMGNGTVICCDASRLTWAKEHLGAMTRDELFSPATIAMIETFVQRNGQSLAGPDLKFVCARSTLCRYGSPNGVCIDLLQDEEVRKLYNVPGFTHALQYRANTDRPDIIACIARFDGQVVGIAGASADCDSLWQIGIDVVEYVRGRGIGKALLAHLTQAVFDAGQIPYYSTVSSNIASRSIAFKVGYWPVWVEMYAR